MGKLEKIRTAGLATKKQNVERGRKAIATVLAMKAEIEKSFYAMGVALKTLKDPAVFRALGHTSFSQLCTVALRTSSGAADRLINIVESFDARDAKKLTSTKATALISLATALGGKTTPKGLLGHGTVHLPTGDVIDVRASDAAAIDRAARQVRARAPRKVHGGRKISKDAAAFFTRLEQELKAHKASSVRVEMIAASKAAGGAVRVTCEVPDADRLGHALIAAAKK